MRYNVGFGMCNGSLAVRHLSGSPRVMANRTWRKSMVFGWRRWIARRLLRVPMTLGPPKHEDGCPGDISQGVVVMFVGSDHFRAYSFAPRSSSLLSGLCMRAVGRTRGSKSMLRF